MDIPKIQWYPGHIAKAEKKLSEVIKKVDLVIEVRDARIPLSTGHPHLNKWINNKKHILVINRSDMISPTTIASWNKWFNAQDQYPHWCEYKRCIGINEICKLLQKKKIDEASSRKVWNKLNDIGISHLELQLLCQRKLFCCLLP